MQKLTELEHSIAGLSKDDFAKFRSWFWEYENEKWDHEIEKDIKGDKLSAFANSALKDFTKGNVTEL